jgi:tight adherence protein B
MTLTNPAYISVLWTDPIGVSLMWYALAAAAGGVLWMRKVIRIHI